MDDGFEQPSLGPCQGEANGCFLDDCDGEVYACIRCGNEFCESGMETRATYLHCLSCAGSFDAE